MLLDVQCSLAKDKPQSILEMTKNLDEDTARFALFPEMDFKGLYNALMLLIDDAGLIHSGLQGLRHSISYSTFCNPYEFINWHSLFSPEFGQSVFSTMIYLIPFLERELLSSLPYIAASSLTQFPVEMHKEIMNYLIYHILPFAVRKWETFLIYILSKFLYV